MLKKDSGWNKVAIVLVNYNGKSILQQCIESIIHDDYQDVEIVVVDNGSTDDSMQQVEKQYSQIHTLYMNKNIGWGAGCNKGAQAAFENGSDYVLLLNTDTEIESGMIQKLLEYSMGSAISIPRIYRDKENKNQSLWYSGGNINFGTADVEQTLYSYDENDINTKTPKSVDFATGCCMLISKTIWEKVGSFDENYFLYYEDVDYCVRLKEADIDIIYVPEAALWHKVGGSSGGETTPISQYYTVRNRLYFSSRYKKYMQADQMDILRDIVEKRTYFSTPYDRRFQRVVLAGIQDYLKGIRGKERNLFHENYTITQGFYEMESKEDATWQWTGENVSEIEIKNPYDEKRVVEFNGSYEIPEGISTREIDVYWNEEYRCSIHAPQIDHCVQGLLDKGESARIKFVVKDDISEEECHVRKLAFCLKNTRVEYHDYKGFLPMKGFYGIEEDGKGKEWQWTGERVSELEIENPNTEEKLLEFTGNLWTPDEVKEREVEVYLDEEYRCSIQAPKKTFCIQKKVKPGEKLRVCFTVKGELPTPVKKERNLVFCLENAQVKYYKYEGYETVKGFYELERDLTGANSWQWSGERDSELEVYNQFGETKLLEFHGNLRIPDEVVKRELEIYWNGEYCCSATAPQERFCLQKVVKAKEKTRISFRVCGKIPEEIGKTRQILWGIDNTSISFYENNEYSFKNGIYGTEMLENQMFYWIGQNDVSLCVYNDKETSCRKRISFTLLPAPTKNRVDVEVICEEAGIDEKRGAEECQYEIDFSPYQKKEIRFLTNDKAVTNINGDSRAFFYQIRNICVVTL